MKAGPRNREGIDHRSKSEKFHFLSGYFQSDKSGTSLGNRDGGI